MKISKKILGVALALIMIFNIFAIGTFAAFPDDTLVKLMIKTDKASYAAGDTVKITISEQSNGELVDMAIGGVYDIKYPTGSLEPKSDAADGLIANHGFVAIQAGYGDGYSNFVNPGYAVEDGYSSIALSIYDDGTAFDATAGVDLFTFEMKIPETCANGTYKIDFNSDAYENYEAFSNDPTLGMGLYGMDPTALGYSAAVMYEFGSCEFKVGPSVEVTHVKQQSKWNGGNDKNTAENYLFGFVGQVSGLALTTEKVGDRDMVKEIKSITATATINGQTVTSDVITVWAVDGGYQFRAQFKGFAPTDTYAASVVFAITMSDGTTVYESAAASRVINDIYTDSLANKFPALAA